MSCLHESHNQILET